MNHEEIEDLNRPITSKRLNQLLVKRLNKQRKVQDKMASLVNSTKYLKKN